ncbi:MAG: hypothetical protein LC777_20825 [Actinobacteria bacterium]|nr:hypothetical protein [Actinomycetota bacterium]
MSDRMSGRGRRARRRFGVVALVLGGALAIAGAALVDRTGVAGAVGLAALAQGIGLVVAGVFLTVGHNPLERHRKSRRPR